MSKKFVVWQCLFSWCMLFLAVIALSFTTSPGIVQADGNGPDEPSDPNGMGVDCNIKHEFLIRSKEEVAQSCKDLAWKEKIRCSMSHKYVLQLYGPENLTGIDVAFAGDVINNLKAQEWNKKSNYLNVGIPTTLVEWLKITINKEFVYNKDNWVVRYSTHECAGSMPAEYYNEPIDATKSGN
jgi:hypothetical protein